MGWLHNNMTVFADTEQTVSLNIDKIVSCYILGFPCGSAGKESPAMQEMWSDPGSGRSPGEGNGIPLQYSRLENSMDKGAWRATVHGVAKNWTQLSD